MNNVDAKVIANKCKWKYLGQDKVNLIRSLYVMSPSTASASSTTFWWAQQTQKESHSEHTICFSRHRTLRTQYLHLGVFLWKQYKSLASYKDFCKLQFLFMFSFTHTNTVFLFKHLPTEIVIFKNVSVSVMIDFLFFRSRFC